MRLSIFRVYLHENAVRYDQLPAGWWQATLFSCPGHQRMTTLELKRLRSDHCQALTGGIFDVDGVLLASPHERAWREALKGFADPGRFTTAMYEAHVAGKPRLSGARAALDALGVPDAERQAVIYAEHKQKLLLELIHAGSFAAFPDALRFVQAIAALGWPMAVASSSKNANQMMQQIHLESRREFARYLRSKCLRSRFAAWKTKPGNFPARRRGIAYCARALLRSRGRARRHRGGMRWRHGGPRCRQTEGHCRIAGRWGESRGN